MGSRVHDDTCNLFGNVGSPDGKAANKVNGDRDAVLNGTGRIVVADGITAECIPDNENRGSDDDFLFEGGLLETLILPENVEVPPDCIIRPLRLSDYRRGYLDLLSQLTTVGDLSEAQFTLRFRDLQRTNPKSYYIVVIEHQGLDKIVGTASLVIEWKFIHHAGCRGRVEDVVVADDFRRLRFGTILNHYLLQLARSLDVYKLSLECEHRNVPFYEKFGYTVPSNTNYMMQRWEHLL